MAGQHRLHLGRIDVVAAGDDQLGTPPTDRHVAVVGHRRQVPRGEPVTGGEGGAAPVAPAQRRAAHEELADALLVHVRRGGLHAGQRQPHRARSTLALERVGQRQQGLGHAVALQHDHTVGGEPVPQIGCQGAEPETHRRRAASTPARPVAASRWYIVGTPKNMVLRGTASSDRVLVEAVEDTAERPRSGCRTARHRGRGHGRAAGEDEAIVGGPPPCGQQRGDPGQQGAVRVHRPLGLAGGARRVDDQRVVARAAARRTGGPACAPAARWSMCRTVRPGPKSRLAGLSQERQDGIGHRR